MKRLLLLVAVFFVGYLGHSQVGIGNTDPKSSLDISATNAASPSSTDGILIPRIDNFPSSDPGADQDGMLVFVTGNGTPSEGFYYWDQGTTSWIAVGGSSTDADWFITGTTNASNAITDNIVTQGSVTVGTDLNGFPNTKLFVKSDAASETYPVRISPEGTPASSATIYGLYNTDASLTPSAAFNYHALYNNFTSTHTGSASGLYNNFNASGGAETGVYNRFNSLSGVYGMRNEFTGTTSSSASFFGIENRMLSSETYGGIVYGFNNTIQAAGNGVRYGLFNSISGSGTGDKYGTYTNIPSTAGGQHYGTYSDVRSGTGFAGYFIGRTSFGTDPSTGRYLLPASDGTAGQVMVTDGSGQLSFADAATEDIDWYEVGTTSAPDAITDDMFTQGNVVIGATTNPANVKFYVESDPASNTTGIRQSMGAASSGLIKGIENSITANGTTNVYGLSNLIGGNSSGLSIQAIRNSFSGNGGRKTGLYNTFAIGFGGDARGLENDFNNTNITSAFGSYNSFGSLNASANAFGTFNTASGSTNAANLYGSRTIFSGATVSGEAYGDYSFIQTSGTDYGIYAHVDNNATDFAGYFVGRTSFGTDSAVGRYLLPATDGSSGQMIVTDGSGQLSFTNPPTNTDDQTIDTLGLVGNTLGISLEDDGQPVQTVDLSNVNFNVSNFALAKMTMSANQTLTIPTYTKVNFDTSAFDLGSNFNTSTDRFEVTEAGAYRISATIHSFGVLASTPRIELLIYIDGSAVKRQILTHTGSGELERHVDTIELLNVGQYIEVYIYSTSNFTLNSGSDLSTFEVERIR